jgi:DtxR family Mn-dependent transcriptional regulator
METKRKEKESTENYLASILDIQKKNGICYSVDVARDMEFSKASVSVAMKKLMDEGLVSFGKTHELLLSTEGHEIAKDVLSKRKLLKDALIAIGVSEKNAEADAHQIEHSISTETNKKLYQYLKKKVKKD